MKWIILWEVSDKTEDFVILEDLATVVLASCEKSSFIGKNKIDMDRLWRTFLFVVGALKIKYLEEDLIQGYLNLFPLLNKVGLLLSIITRGGGIRSF